MAVPSELLKLFGRSSQIRGLELFEALSAVFELADARDGRDFTIYGDDEAVSEALVKGDSSFHPAASVIARFWLLCETRPIAVWIERVWYGDNIADLPTSNAKIPIPFRRRAELPPRNAFIYYSTPIESRNYLFRMSRRVR